MRPEDTCGCSGVMHFIVHSTWPVSLGLTKYYCGSHTTSITAWIQRLGFFTSGAISIKSAICFKYPFGIITIGEKQQHSAASASHTPALCAGKCFSPKKDCRQRREWISPMHVARSTARAVL